MRGWVGLGMSAGRSLSASCATVGWGCSMGFRPGTLQTAEGEFEIEFPQVRQAAETFASELFPEDAGAVADRAGRGRAQCRR
jgi:hypothetical protein